MERAASARSSAWAGEPAPESAVKPTEISQGEGPAASASRTRAHVRGGPRPALGVHEDDGELVAAAARRGRPPAPRARGLRRGAEQRVAGAVPALVVDPLEAIDVGEREPGARGAALGERELARQHLVERAPVGDAREAVRARLALELTGQPLQELLPALAFELVGEQPAQHGEELPVAGGVRVQLAAHRAQRADRPPVGELEGAPRRTSPRRAPGGRAGSPRRRRSRRRPRGCRRRRAP
jgi:hypothetical protein